MSGFFKVSKGLSGHEMFRSNPHYLAAYIWLLDNASFTDRVVRFAGHNWPLKKGQIVITIRKLSTVLKPWGFTEKSTRRFIENLCKYNIVEQQVNKHGQVLTLKEGKAEGTPKGTLEDMARKDATPDNATPPAHKNFADDTGKGTLTDTPKGTQIEEGDKKGRTPLPPEGGCVEKLFFTFWEKWPSHHRKNGKTSAKRLFMKLSENEAKGVIEALGAAKVSEAWKKEEGKYIPKPSNWLKEEGYQHHLEGVNSAKKAKERSKNLEAKKQREEAEKQAQKSLEKGYEAYLDDLAEKAAENADLEALEKKLTPIARRSFRNNGATSPLVRNQLFSQEGIKPKTLNQWIKNNENISPNHS